MNLKNPAQIIAIGAAIVFSLPIAIGIVVGHLFGLWLGMAAGVFALLAVIFLAHRQIMKRAREQEEESKMEDKSDHA